MKDTSSLFTDNKKRQKLTWVLYCLWGAAFMLLIFICAKAAYIRNTDPHTANINAVIMAVGAIIESPLTGYYWGSEFWPICCVMLLIGAFAAWCLHDRNYADRHYADGEQYGSASFQTSASIRQFNRHFNAPYGRPIAEGTQNTILSTHCCLGNDTRKTRMNLNIVVEGAPGSGKSHNIVKPNILQADGSASYVITDPSGELLAQTGCFLKKQGYDIKVFNIEDMSHSYRYNPLSYVREDKDVLTLIKCFIDNTDGHVNRGDPFWPKAERNLYEAIIFYLKRCVPEEQRNFAKMLDMVRNARQDPEGTRNGLDTVFEEVRRADPTALCVKKYDIFKLAPAKTIQSILISAGTRLDPFDIDDVGNLTSRDELDLRSIGDRPTALFIVVPQGDDTYQFIMNMLYTQLFDTLYYHAKHDLGELKLPCDIRFILDEFSNTGVISNFDKKLTTMRKYGMSCMIFIQSLGQLEDLYDKSSKTIMDACDTLVYLGGNDLKTMEDISKKVGVQTVRVRDRNSSKTGARGTDGKSFRYTKRELLTPDEVRRLKPGHAIILIKGQQPFYDTVYDPFKHPCSKYLGNDSTGENIYRFDYCIAEVKPVSEIYEMRTGSAKQSIIVCAQGGRSEKRQIQTVRDLYYNGKVYAGPSGSPENAPIQKGATVTTNASGYKVYSQAGCYSGTLKH